MGLCTERLVALRATDGEIKLLKGGAAIPGVCHDSDMMGTA